MKKTKEYIICDRCKKELEKDSVNGVCGFNYFYDLCDECKKDFDKYKSEVKELDNQWEEITKKYQFEKYLPKEDELEGKSE